MQAGVLTSGFACSTDPSVASASSPALYTWLPRYADWLTEQLGKVESESGGGAAKPSVAKQEPAKPSVAKQGTAKPSVAKQGTAKPSAVKRSGAPNKGGKSPRGL